MDFRGAQYETASVPSSSPTDRPHRLPLRRVLLRRVRLAGATALAATSLIGCDSIKARLYPPNVDAAWQSDSSFLAQNPTVLLRVVRSEQGTRAVPIASVGARGLRPLGLSTRGWRALDVQMLHGQRTFVPYRGSRALAPVASARGMWESTTLDSIPGCAEPLPAASLDAPAGVELLTNGTTPLPASADDLGAGELQEVLNVVTTLVAPSAGVPLSLMSRYKRDVAVVGTGATASPTIVVTYEDPEELPDSVTRIAERPRQVILVLDKGVYGYKPSLTLSDVSTTRISPRRRFLGALDADSDGKSELFFGLGNAIDGGELVTYTYRFTGDTWIADWEFTRTRCRR